MSRKRRKRKMWNKKINGLIRKKNNDKYPINYTI